MRRTIQMPAELTRPIFNFILRYQIVIKIISFEFAFIIEVRYV